MKEIWKKVKDYEDYLEVSNLGRVRSIKRLVNAGHSDYEIGGKLKSANPDKQGYLGVGINNRKEGWRKRLQIHRLVAITFIPNPLNKPTVNHKDGDKSNNRVDNLEWMTYSENTKHALKTGLLKHNGKFVKLLLILLLLASCSKESIEICGTITGGDYDYLNDMYYLRVDGKRHWVDMKTYESYFVGDYICLEAF